LICSTWAYFEFTWSRCVLDQLAHLIVLGQLGDVLGQALLCAQGRISSSSSVISATG
jgi:hypothetical protein